jgi:hypothetical protein
MPTYRAYFIDKNNCVVSFKPLSAESDERALLAAKQLVDGLDIEVWQLDRMIGRLASNAPGGLPA